MAGYAFLGQLVAMVAKTRAGGMLPLGITLIGATESWVGGLAGKKVLGLPERARP